MVVTSYKQHRNKGLHSTHIPILPQNQQMLNKNNVVIKQKNSVYKNSFQTRKLNSKFGSIYWKERTAGYFYLHESFWKNGAFGHKWG